MEVALINKTALIDNSPIADNAVITKFIPYVLIAQKLFLLPILGRPLYEELQTQIKAADVEPAPDPYPITPHNQALLIEIAPALAFYTVYQGLPFHWASVLNKGVTLLSSENSDPVAVDDIAQLRRWIKDDAQTLAGELLKYLEKCAINYPLWAAPGGGTCGKPAPSPVDDDHGIFIPKRRAR